MPYDHTIKKVLVIGSGPIVIGQAAEFDYAGTQACLALKEEGIEVVLVNNNPATIMTDSDIADKIYIEPMTIESIEKILEKEQPDGLIGTLGGQTGLNLTVQLYEKDMLKKHGVRLLGTSVESIQKGEDREKFRQLMIDINEPIPESKIIESMSEGLTFVEEIGYPVIIRPAYTLGGAGGGFAYNEEQFKQVLRNGLSLSPIHQVLVEKSIKGWKEVEYEVVRDHNDTCIIVCNMENLDPVGVHTGDSIVVAPSQTLSDEQYQILRNSSVKVIRELGIVGGCNIQFAMDPVSNKYYIIEVNPRVSRSSALASKATGYPIARIAAKCAIGYHLDEIKNPITDSTFASFEPAIDYIVVKLPRFPFDKFPEADRKLGTQMKATGETMAMDRTFEGALNKALRSLESKVYGLTSNVLQHASKDELKSHLTDATDLRLFAIAELMKTGTTIKEIHELTAIDYWFLTKMENMIVIEQKLTSHTLDTIPEDVLHLAKKMNFSDKYISNLLGCSEDALRTKRLSLNILPSYKLVDTCAAEFEAVTPYYYSTYHGFDEVEVSTKKKALIIGSGPIRIGQGIEFDYCSVHAVHALKKMGYETIVVNNNPETVSTDYSIADKLYFEPLTVEDILHIAHKEQVEGVFVSFGGQTAINLANDLKEAGLHFFGSSIESIDKLEDRDLFYQLLEKVNIPHVEGKIVYQKEEVWQTVQKLQYPVLVRPSYVIGGQSMSILYNDAEVQSYLDTFLSNDERSWPLLVDQYIAGKECELDAVSDGENIFVPGIFEHIEKAGVHSGDSMTVFPPQTISKSLQEQLVAYTELICKEAGVIGVVNIQFVIDNNQIYVIEVNPRASRTVPILSKVTGIPIIEEAIKTQLGYKLQQTGLAQHPPLVAVKAPIFSSTKLKDVDPVLGPEMKSTGELLGLGYTYEQALEKSFSTSLSELWKGTKDNKAIFCSFTDREKKHAHQIKQLADKGFTIYATAQTAAYLSTHHINAIAVEKNKENLQELFSNEQLLAAIILPTKGRDKTTIGSYMRELALRFDVTLFTHMDTVVSALSIQPSENASVHHINEYLLEVINN